MQLRPATSADKQGIIHLLRKSLGESTIQKSEALWSWKHEQNPFGASYILLAEENDMLIGVRALMQWEWQRKGLVYKAVRAVDTATHPDHTGKGIFKTLTLQQIELCKKEGVYFVFNTPNEQSKPGYLKMGWTEQGKMPVKTMVLKPFSIAYAKLARKEKPITMPEDPTPFQKWTHSVLELPNRYIQNNEQLTTVLSPEYISWRYANNPLFRYNYFTDHEHFLLISRIKDHSFAKELRIVDFLLLDPSTSHRHLSVHIKKTVLSFCKTHAIGFISLSGQQYRHYKPYFKWMGVLPVRSIGPLITLKDLNMNEKFHYLLDTRNWCYSLGDMELF